MGRRRAGQRRGRLGRRGIGNGGLLLGESRQSQIRARVRSAASAIAFKPSFTGTSPVVSESVGQVIQEPTVCPKTPTNPPSSTISVSHFYDAVVRPEAGN
jgi:hypothetical protein